MTYGLRGMAYFEVGVECSTKDLHSGVYGGTVHEGMIDLVHLMSSLVDSNGNILIDGIMADVAPVTETEKASYKDIDFDLEEYMEDAGVDKVSHKLMHDNKMVCCACGCSSKAYSFLLSLQKLKMCSRLFSYSF
jgi:nonspecific dipeptidase